MKKLFHTGLPICVLLVSLAGAAQDNEKKDKAEFKLGGFYTSRLHYYGRTDSLRSSGFFPVAEFRANKNFYITAAPVFVMNNTTGFAYAGTVATAGLRFARDNNYTANICIIKPVYKHNNQLVQSALKWQAVATWTWLNEYINLTAGADAKISDKTDFGLTAGLDHIFRKECKGGLVLVLDPSVVLNAGTRQFVRTSYKRSGFLGFPGVQQEVTEEVKKFNILSYEFSMPLVLARNKVQLVLDPAYVIPQNLVKVDNRPDLSEKGKEMFYITAGAKLSF